MKSRFVYPLFSALLLAACSQPGGAHPGGDAGASVASGQEGGVASQPTLQSVRRLLLNEGFEVQRKARELQGAVEVMVSARTGETASLPTDPAVRAPVLVWKDDVVVRQLLVMQPSYLGLNAKAPPTPSGEGGTVRYHVEDDSPGDACCVGICFGELLPEYYYDPYEAIFLCQDIYCPNWGPEMFPECYDCQPCAGQACGVDQSCGTGQSCGTCSTGYACNGTGTACAPEYCPSGNFCNDSCCPGLTDGCINSSCCSVANECGQQCCTNGQTCVNQESASPQCCDSTAACGNSCCGIGTTCTGSTCCPDNNVCGEQCLSTGQTCVDGQVCKADQVCGDDCCSASQYCTPDGCSACDSYHTQCAGNACCDDTTETCTSSGCCPNDNACGINCCGSNQGCDYTNGNCVDL